MIKECTDEQLLAKMYEGNQFAFDEIHNRYAHNMYVYAYNILNLKQESEDIIQNIFISFWLKRKEVTIENLSSYLFRAVKFQVFNHFRNRKIREEDVSRLNILDISREASSNMEFEDLKKRVDACVLRLPNRCQEIFRLSRFENMSHKEIASELDISVQGVKNQISKGIKIVKKSLLQENMFFVLILKKYLKV